MTLGEDGSGFSKEQPRFFPLVAVAGNMGEAWPPFKLPLFLSLLLREVEREICEESLPRPGLKIDFEGSFMEDEEDKREVKQMNSSLLVFVVQILVVVVVVVAVALLLLLLVLRWGGLSLSISCLFVYIYFFLLLCFGHKQSQSQDAKRFFLLGVVKGLCCVCRWIDAERKI